MDAQYVNLQNEYTALNKLLESVQNDKVSTIDAPQVLDICSTNTHLAGGKNERI